VNVTDIVGGTQLTGLTPTINVLDADAALDSLRVNTFGGIDFVMVNQTGGAGALRRILIDAGADADSIAVANTAADGTVTLLPSAGNDNVNVNDDGAGVANLVLDATQRIGTLTVSTGGRATLAAGGEKVLTMSALNIFGTGKFDLTDNNAIVDYSTFTPANSIRLMLGAGFNNGAWNGGGIVSSVAAAESNSGIGFTEATDLFTSFSATFKGQPIDNTAILLAHTLYGDADLNGTVNLLDFNRLSSSFGGSGKRWSQGDFDYNGSVNLLDFNRLAANFGQPSAGSQVLPRDAGLNDDLLA
jgi:hypothetical protein